MNNNTVSLVQRLAKIEAMFREAEKELRGFESLIQDGTNSSDPFTRIQYLKAELGSWLFADAAKEVDNGGK